jgi:hypothetical protein
MLSMPALIAWLPTDASTDRMVADGCHGGADEAK